MPLLRAIDRAVGVDVAGDIVSQYDVLIALVISEVIGLQIRDGELIAAPGQHQVRISTPSSAAACRLTPRG